ncbi:MAG: DUF5057 domain-containing protein [Lachnospiraceae bacterium]|nr:DUF5057 domain-containing protein [Lachnospiraceae bacterium]
MSKKLSTFLKRTLSVALVVSVTAGGIYYAVDRNTIDAQAAEDALLSIQRIRNEILSDSSAKFSILEIVPDHSMAEMGYTIDGCEPFPVLYDATTNTYQPWSEKLAGIATKEDRAAFMAELSSEADQILSSIASDYANQSQADLPFRFEPYNEVSDLSEVAADDDRLYTEVPFEQTERRGKFRLHTGSASDKWHVSFNIVSDGSIRLIDVNNGTGTVYYNVASDAQLTYADLSDLAANHPELPIYTKATSGYYIYAGNAKAVWDDMSGSVTGNDASFDWSVELSEYYSVQFQYITNNQDNQVKVGDWVYMANLYDVYTSNDGEYEFFDTYEENGEAGDTVIVSGASFWYCGGLVNHHTFLREVFGLDSYSEIPIFGIEVYVVTPSELNAMIGNADTTSGRVLSEFDYVSVVAGGNARVTVTDDTFGTMGWTLDANGDSTGVPLTAYYNASDDLSVANARTFALHLYHENIPVQVDISDRFAGTALAGTATDTNLTRALNFMMLSENPVPGSAEMNKIGLLNADQSGFANDGAFNGLTNGAILPSFSIDTEHDLMFVRGCAWFFDGNTAPLLDVQNYVGTFYGSDTDDTNGHIAGGLADVVNLIIQENLQRDSDVSFESDERLSTEVYDATIIRHIMSATEIAKVKEALNILVVEPASQVYNAGSGLDKARFSALTGVKQDNITITCMNMNLFISKIDDLNNVYDVIYFDASTTNMSTQYNSTTLMNETVFNDTGMNGLRYFNVGDMTRGGIETVGFLATEWENSNRPYRNATHRFSGNDLSREAYNKLLDFKYASYPIIIDQQLLTVNPNDGSYTVNAYRVDSSSYLYEFLDLVKGDKNVFSSGELNGAQGYQDRSALFKYYANRAKLSLDSEYENCLMLGEEYYTVNGNPNGEVKILRASSDQKYYIPYSFTIRNLGAVSSKSDYICKVFVDSNADGKFSDLNELVAQYNGLSADNKNEITVQVPSTYYGCITWKLEVCQSDNEYVRNSTTGYLKLEPMEEIPVADRTIKVLQVHMLTTGRNDVINLEESIGHWNGDRYVDATSAGPAHNRHKTNYFQELASQISDDYILDITTVGMSNWEENDYKISDFDMLILGFSDALDGADLQPWQTSFVKSFIQSGKSVLFAHDMTSYIGMPANIAKNNINNYIWGYQMNAYIRSYVGLDTYGISDSEYNTNSAALYRGVSYTRNSAGELQNGNYKLVEPSKDANSRDGAYYLYNEHDIAYTPGSGRNTTVPQVQGYAYAHLITHEDGNWQNYLNSRYDGGMARLDTQKGVRINAGQITTFPFNLNGSNTITLGLTHPQYFTLDFSGDSDGDGESDIVVWYNLDTNVERGHLVDNDPKNDYYLYSKGNVMYTGMGHNASNGTTNAVSVDEAKLFLNTIIASYNTGMRTPNVDIMDESGVSTSAIYGYYDPNLEIGLTGENDQNVTIRFRVTDMNLQGEKKGTVRFFREKPGAGNVDLDGVLLEGVDERTDAYTVYLWEDYKAHGTGAAAQSKTSLENGVDYCVIVKLSDFVSRVENESSNTVSNFDSNFYIAVQDEITIRTALGGTVTNHTPWSVSPVTYTTIELFDLD